MTKPAGPDGPTHTNRLADESSPYLRQHMHNPVDWWPWCDEAFEKAKAEDKPVFLSIGYSTCHWCHVMAHESFEDPAVGGLLNRDFISIKLDREERPDLDGIYMTALQQVSGHGGWPMSVMLDHDRRPFFLGTYFPKDDRYGRPGFRTLLARIVEVWRTRRDEILDAAKGIIDAVAKSDTTEPGEVQGEQVLSAAVGQLTRRFDTQNGGFGAKPKFPTPHVFSLLLREARRAGIEEVRDAARHMAHFSLRKLINGGIHDHVGGGFHRYSTDEIWRLPHFEKMLYDQALLATAFIDGYSLTGDPELADAARGIFRYVLRDLRDPSGGFWSAEDADSEGHEGTFYVFTKAQVSDVLGPDDGARVANLFQFSDQGNYADEASGKRDGTNILHLHRDNEPDLDRAKYQQEIWPLLDRLRQWRDQRIRPHLDDKVLASWNGLMLSALARGAGGWVPSPTNATPIGTGERANPDTAQLVTAALELGRFLLTEMRGPEGLWHNWHRGRASIPGFLDDYAFVAYGLLNLYQLTLEVEWLEASTALAHEMIRLFADRDADGNPLGFFFTREGQADVLVRRKEAYDGAEPSGNSVACDLLLRLGRLLGDAEFLAAGDGVLRAFAGRLSDFASGHCRMAIAISDALANPAEVTIVTESPDQGTELLAVARSSGPTTQLIHLHSANRDRLVALSPSLAGMKLPEQTTAAAFVCRGGVCSLPVTGASDLMQALQA